MLGITCWCPEDRHDRARVATECVEGLLDQAAAEQSADIEVIVADNDVRHPLLCRVLETAEGFFLSDRLECSLAVPTVAPQTKFRHAPMTFFRHSRPSNGRAPTLRRGANIATARALAHAMRMWHAGRMSKMIQVRDVPDRLHRELVRRASARNETLTQYVQGILEREVARPPAEQVFARIRSRQRVKLDRPVSEVLREERQKRGAA